MDSADILSYENDCLRLGFPKNYIFLDESKNNSTKEKLEQIARYIFPEKHID